MLYLNIPAKYAMERGGWSDIKTMDKIYQFTFKDQKKVVDDRINDFFPGPSGHNPYGISYGI